jgi:DedD protein
LCWFVRLIFYNVLNNKFILFFVREMAVRTNKSRLRRNDLFWQEKVMAKQSTDDEQSIKRKARRRLVGAVALALAAVVVLPMVLDSEPKPTAQDIDLRIPASDKVGEFVPGAALSEVVEASAVQVPAVSDVPAIAEPMPSVTVHSDVVEVKPEPVAVKPVEVKSIEVKPVEVKPVVKPVEVKPVVKPVEVKPVVVKPAEVKKPEVKPVEIKKVEVKPVVKPVESKPVEVKALEAKPVDKPLGTFIVQTGAFSNVDTAIGEAEKLKAAGFKAYTELINGTMRVRMGPYKSRDAADEIRTQLEKRGLHPAVSEVK